MLFSSLIFRTFDCMLISYVLYLGMVHHDSDHHVQDHPQHTTSIPCTSTTEFQAGPHKIPFLFNIPKDKPTVMCLVEYLPGIKQLKVGSVRF